MFSPTPTMGCDESATRFLVSGPLLVTPETVLIDGPNGITGAPRAGFPDATWTVGLGVVVLLLVAVLMRTRAPRLVVALVMVMAAAPGLWTLVVSRADAPHRRAGVAAVVTSGLADLRRLTAGPVGGVTVVRDDADVLFPLARYQWPARPPDGGVRVELRGSSLTSACHVPLRGDVVVCGVGP
jgi:hypothetical protein